MDHAEHATLYRISNKLYSKCKVISDELGGDLQWITNIYDDAIYVKTVIEYEGIETVGIIQYFQHIGVKIDHKSIF